MHAASYVSDAEATGVSFVACDRSVRLAGLWLVQLAFWKDLPDALHTCCYPADDDYKKREGVVFTDCLLCTGYCVGCWLWVLPGEEAKEK